MNFKTLLPVIFAYQVLSGYSSNTSGATFLVPNKVFNLRTLSKDKLSKAKSTLIFLGPY
jgi:hypothetical protein